MGWDRSIANVPIFKVFKPPQLSYFPLFSSPSRLSRLPYSRSCQITTTQLLSNYFWFSISNTKTIAPITESKVYHLKCRRLHVISISTAICKLNVFCSSLGNSLWTFDDVAAFNVIYNSCPTQLWSSNLLCMWNTKTVKLRVNIPTYGVLGRWCMLTLCA